MDVVRLCSIQIQHLHVLIAPTGLLSKLSHRTVNKLDKVDKKKHRRGSWVLVGGGPDPHPLENNKALGILSNTGPDPLENHIVAKPAFNVGPYRPANETTFETPNGVSLAGQLWPDFSGIWILPPLIS